MLSEEKTAGGNLNVSSAERVAVTPEKKLNKKLESKIYPEKSAGIKKLG